MAFKLILLDIDDTLATSQKQISPNTKAALLNVQQYGIKLALCSGRPGRGLYSWAEELRMTEHGGFSSAITGVRCSTARPGRYCSASLFRWRTQRPFWSM